MIWKGPLQPLRPSHKKEVVEHCCVALLLLAGLPVDAVAQVERHVLVHLGHDVGAISALRCCHLLLERLGQQHMEQRALNQQVQVRGGGN